MLIIEVNPLPRPKSLSDAMRLGALMYPPTTGALVDDKGACALGAAAMVAGFVGEKRPSMGTLHPRTSEPMTEEGDDITYIHMPGEWLPLLLTERPCPECGEELEMYILIAHLNDTHLWDRSRIADLVESVEKSLEPKPIGDPCPSSLSSSSSS